MLSHWKSHTHQYPYYLFRWTSYWNFPWYIFIFQMKKKLILLSHICNIEYMGLIRFFGYGLSNWMVMLIVQRTVLFVHLLRKKAIVFSSSSFCYLFSFVYYRTVQNYIERFNLAIENIELFKCSGTIQTFLATIFNPPEGLLKGSATRYFVCRTGAYST